jgi:hypothetical protein
MIKTRIALEKSKSSMKVRKQLSKAVDERKHNRKKKRNYYQL